MKEVFDRADGTLLGWKAKTRDANGRNIPVFIPRREEDVESDRGAITALIARANPGRR